MNKITLNKVRSIFLDHVKNHSEYPHTIISSSALAPDNDPTTLFTGSGMQPMLPYLLGQKHPLGVRIADSQKCFRSQDIEEVGDNRHTTFFEMLGNWSLGDFFKEGQIDIIWDFLINKINLDPNRMYFSVYRGNESLGICRDEVAIKKWQEKFESVNIKAEVGMSPESDGMIAGHRVFAYPDKKNWWSRSGVPEKMPIGEPGGPDTEMFYDFDPDNKNKTHEKSEWKNDICHINCDCGRFVEIGNNVFMQYQKTETGLAELDQKNVDFGGGLERICAAINNDSDVFNLDVFDGAKNILEKMSDQKYVSDLSVSFMHTTSPTFAYRVILDHVRAATFLIGDGIYPGNKDQQYFVRRLIRRAVRFARNLNIHDNFIKEVANTFIDYYKLEYPNLGESRENILKSLDDEESKFRKTLENGLKEFERISKRDHYEMTSLEVVPEKKRIFGHEAFNLLQSFGFPIELTQEIAKERGFEIDIEDFKILKNKHAEESRTASAGKFKGGLGGDGEIETKYHTATHMLHEALRQVLGEHVYQKGSNITSERLRFDFSHDRKMTDEEKKKVEDIVNSQIKADLKVIREEVSYERAREMGAIGVFDNKYTDMVSVYHVGDFSLEFCGGPHVESTGNMGNFKILKEEAVSQGVRRIKAILE
jgi:alanyl-tRNA synthetase